MYLRDSILGLLMGLHWDMLSKQLESCELGQCPASVEEKTHCSRRNAMHMGTSPERVVDSTFACISQCNP